MVSAKILDVVPQLQKTMPISQWVLQSEHCFFGRVFEKLEDLGVVHVGDEILRFFAELVDLLRLSQVLKEGFLGLGGSRTFRSNS